MEDYRGIPDWANDYLGLEWQEFGRGPAYDCWGLVRQIYADRKGIRLPSLVGDYESTLDRQVLPVLFDEEIADHWKEVDDPRSLDCAVFEVFRSKMHVGVMLTHEWLLHIQPGLNVHLDHVSELSPFLKLAGYYRHVDDQ